MKNMIERFRSLSSIERERVGFLVAFVLFCILVFGSFIVGCVDVANAAEPTATLTEDLPDFVSYLEEQGYDLTGYDYYTVEYVKGEHIFILSTTVPYFCLNQGYYSIHYSQNYFVVYSPNDGFTCVVNNVSDFYWRVSAISYSDIAENRLIYSSCDVCDENGTVFFLKTPYHISTLVGGLTGQRIAEALIMEMVGLIPLAVGLTLLAMSLYKGCSSLWKTLTRLFLI